MAALRYLWALPDRAGDAGPSIVAHAAASVVGAEAVASTDVSSSDEAAGDLVEDVSAVSP